MWSLLEYFHQKIEITVLDIGAALSEQPPYQPLLDAGCARIIGFEPNAEECARLNTEYAGKPHVFYPYFVGDGQPATFHETNWSLTGSLYEPNTPLLEVFQNLAELVTPVGTHPVKTTCIDDIVEIQDVDFIKIDIQGGELNVFRHALRILPATLLIQTEVEFLELYKQQPMFSDIDPFLRGQGFQFHTFNGFGGRAFKPVLPNNDVNTPVRQMLWSDAIYVRDWMRLSALPEPKLIKYAVLAHDVLQSFDLAHYVLLELDRRTGKALAPAYLQRLSTAAE